jgi:hypothetical protein
MCRTELIVHSDRERDARLNLVLHYSGAPVCFPSLDGLTGLWQELLGLERSTNQPFEPSSLSIRNWCDVGVLCCNS